MERTCDMVPGSYNNLLELPFSVYKNGEGQGSPLSASGTLRPSKGNLCNLTKDLQYDNFAMMAFWRQGKLSLIEN